MTGVTQGSDDRMALLALVRGSLVRRQITDAFEAADARIAKLEAALKLYAGCTDTMGVEWFPLNDGGGVARAVLASGAAGTS